ncbi:uncharacterized protein PHACADRAFT_251381 [Phanerochaete carnosa HHB-10118-sp]|uniref:DUF6533 domain-containing protein n=1 Tax=Phanerochaete carnosa (strain HHB-10118-sp) TaxID=650164 RepID=K5WEY4_PHACS|nr:uncharacterized protein PHACADRAFT_251381 [Phanerochaete carnosa HHB-10118-sp]EKM57644.1 hypothetical protein PHACADRAFT_251381 [Phanerochaete carnosa HHB-10118-sp]
MSAQPDQALDQAYWQFLVSNYSFAAVACLVFYEFLITIDNEVKVVWKRPITASAVLLGSVRWCVLLSIAVQLLPSTPNTCPPLEILTWILILIGFVQTALFSALRVFAVWDRSHVWSLVVFALSMVPFATNLFKATQSTFSSVGDSIVGMTCASEYPYSARTYDMLAYITRGSLILADTTVLTLTWVKTFGNWWRARGINVNVSLTTCLLRDALLAISIIQLLTFDSSADLAPVSALITALPPVLINRFMINLRIVNSDVPDYSMRITDRQQGQSTVQFRRSTIRLGNIGGTLQNGWDDDRSWDEEGSAAEVDEAGGSETNAEALPTPEITP